MKNTDILFRSTDKGTQIWFMEGHKIRLRLPLVAEDGKTPMLVGPPWSIMGVGDFNGDGVADILFQNTANEMQIWFMHGARIVSRHNIVDEHGKPILIGSPWSIVGVGDFDRNGRADILWHSSNNETQIWFMDQHKIINRQPVVGKDGKRAAVGKPWRIVGAGDFNRDGMADILWYNDTSHETQIWYMDQHTVTGTGTVVSEDGKTPIFVGGPWSIVGVGDFNGDSRADILWHNSTSHEAQIWLMDGKRISSRVTVAKEDGTPIPIAPPWSIVGTGVFVPPPKPKSPREKPENPELGDPTGGGDDKKSQFIPMDPPPEDRATRNPDNQIRPTPPPTPPPATGCFIGNTPVLMADGLTKTIDAIGVGDQVMARDEKTGLVAPGAVARVFRHRVAETLLLQMDGGEVVETTAEHRFAAGERGFVSAGQLRPGDRLSTHSERGAGIVSTQVRSAEANVYNLSVDRFHTFFIGGAGLWVHNDKKSDVTPDGKPIVP